MVHSKYRIATVIFDDSPLVYHRMAQALELSVHCNAGDVRLQMFHCKTPTGTIHENVSFAWNTLKLRFWEEAVLDALDAGERIVLLDADMLVLRDLSQVFSNDKPFDIGITFRPDGFLNGGAIYVDSADGCANAIRLFFHTWRSMNDALYFDPKTLEQFFKVHPGMNQTSLFHILGLPVLGPVCIKKLTTLEWNCMNSDWHLFNSSTAVLHIKGVLRGVCAGLVNEVDLSPRLGKRLSAAFLVWKQYYDCISSTE